MPAVFDFLFTSFFECVSFHSRNSRNISLFLSVCLFSTPRTCMVHPTGHNRETVAPLTRIIQFGEPVAAAAPQSHQTRAVAVATTYSRALAIYNGPPDTCSFAISSIVSRGLRRYTRTSRTVTSDRYSSVAIVPCDALFLYIIYLLPRSVARYQPLLRHYIVQYITTWHSLHGRGARGARKRGIRPYCTGSSCRGRHEYRRREPVERQGGVCDRRQRRNRHGHHQEPVAHGPHRRGH